jgi:Na+-driven multidrug efflux pump
MKNIFLVLGLVFGVTLGASELFAQSNGRKKNAIQKRRHLRK